MPSKEFRQVVYNNFGNLGYGINTGLILSPLLERRPSPFLIGLDFSYFTYGQEKDGATANTPRLKSTYNVYTWNGLVRIRPPLEKGAITPFADGLLGLKLYTTKTKVDKNLLDSCLRIIRLRYSIMYAIQGWVLVPGADSIPTLATATPRAFRYAFFICGVTRSNTWWRTQLRLTQPGPLLMKRIGPTRLCF